MKSFIIFLFLLLFTNVCLSESADFRQSKWRMSKSDIKKIEGKPIAEGKDLLGFNRKLNGWNSVVIYKFIDKKFYTGGYLFAHKHSNTSEYIIDFNQLRDLLFKKYGKPKNEGSIWKNNLYKKTPKDYGLAVSIGHLKKVAFWETKRSRITLQLNGDNYKIDFSLLYETLDQDLQKIAKKKENKDILENL